MHDTTRRPVWRFEDSTGTTRTGWMDRFTDFGGTDVTYWFRDPSDDSLHLVSGQRLRNAQRLWDVMWHDNALVSTR